MIDTAVGAAVPARWMAANEAYGNATALRAHLRQQGLGYVVAVSRSHHIPSLGKMATTRLRLISLLTAPWSRSVDASP